MTITFTNLLYFQVPKVPIIHLMVSTEKRSFLNIIYVVALMIICCYDMLYYAMLCCAVLCYAMLCSAVP